MGLDKNSCIPGMIYNVINSILLLATFALFPLDLRPDLPNECLGIFRVTVGSVVILVAIWTHLLGLLSGLNGRHDNCSSPELIGGLQLVTRVIGIGH